MKIYVAYHKECKQLTSDELYTPLHVGKAISKVNLNMIGDDTGDHISEKNGSFCETTGLYWMWKNTNHEYVGLSHYRRYFSAKEKTLGEQLLNGLRYLIGMGKKRRGVIYAKSTIKRCNQILDLETAKKLLAEYDVIIPQKRYLKRSIEEQYAIRRPNNDLKIVGEIIQERHPEYMQLFTKAMANNAMYACNMFLMKKELFDDYMEWLFDILFELEKRVDLTGYSSYHQRIYGFIAERLLIVWLGNQTAQVKELPVLYFKGE
ncbi:DUF4422 domain-containing protein [Puteibacter caeruleilacunae]|nr:DUF4422 domain-containing protein [Puteibacter caeruleilacunae]